jgi:hypothetical protein
LSRISHSQPFWALKSAFERHLHKRNPGTNNTIGIIVGVLVAFISIASLIGAYLARKWNRNRNEGDLELEMQKDEEMDRKALEAQNKQWEWRGSKLPTQEWRKSWSSQAPSDVDVDVKAGGEYIDHFGTPNPQRNSTLSKGRQQLRKSTLSNHINAEGFDLDAPELPQIPSKAWRASNMSNFSMRSIAYSESEEGRLGKATESREGRWSCAILE